MNAKTLLGWGVAVLTLAAASCAAVGGPTSAVPPEVKVTVVNFAPSTDVGISTEINFSVTNLTDRELTGLTLTIKTNPANGVDLPYCEMAIDRIDPRGTWNPGPFSVRGRLSGTTAVFFIVSRDGVPLAKDYALVGVSPDDPLWDRPY
jgi:hypothetical protein